MKQGIQTRIPPTQRIRAPTARSPARPIDILSNPNRRLGLDKFAILPIVACAFALIVEPLLIFYLSTGPQSLDARPETRFFWPAMAVASVFLFIQNRSRPSIPPHIIILFAYLGFAGVSVLWAFSFERSAVRYLQQVMIVITVVLSALQASRNVDLIRIAFLCFVIALILNTLFVLAGSVTIVRNGAAGLVNIGYQGYYQGKNYLGECATLAFLLSLDEVRQRRWRRALGAVVCVTAVTLIYLSDSKTALGLALICPIIAALSLLVRRATRLSPATILLTIPACWILLSSVSSFSFQRLGYMLYGDSSLTGRTVIWDFVVKEIEQSPLVGWGYQSFWLVPNSPGLSAPGWVSSMPNSHNGYYDTILEMGYVGLAFLIVFIVATLHAVGRVADRDPRRAQLLLSLVLFLVLWNFFESLWMRGFEFMWVVFLIVAAEIGRYWTPFSRGAVASRSSRGAKRVGSQRLPRQGLEPSS